MVSFLLNGTFIGFKAPVGASSNPCCRTLRRSTGAQMHASSGQRGFEVSGSQPFFRVCTKMTFSPPTFSFGVHMNVSNIFYSSHLAFYPLPLPPPYIYPSSPSWCFLCLLSPPGLPALQLWPPQLHRRPVCLHRGQGPAVASAAELQVAAGPQLPAPAVRAAHAAGQVWHASDHGGAIALKHCMVQGLKSMVYGCTARIPVQSTVCRCKQ